MTFDKRELTYIRIVASLVGIISAASLIALLAQSAFAADPAPPPARAGGLQPGARTFTNPFANVNPTGQPAGKNNFFDDDDTDDAELPPGAATPPPMPPSPGGGGVDNAYGAPGGAMPPGGYGSVNAGGSPQSANGPASTFGPNGVSVGGGSPGGVIEHNAQRSVHIDDETGEGSKEVVTDFNYPDADIMDIAKTLGRLTGQELHLRQGRQGPHHASFPTVRSPSATPGRPFSPRWTSTASPSSLRAATSASPASATRATSSSRPTPATSRRTPTR